MTHWTSKPNRRNKKKRWFSVDIPNVEELSTTSDEELSARPLQKGFYLWFLIYNMQTMYAAPSDKVMLTRGVLDYLYDYSRWGPNKTRGKLFLCSEYNLERQCKNGFLCREVHCALCTNESVEASKYDIITNANGCPTVADPSISATRVPDNALLRHTVHTRWTPPWMYPRLPSGVTFRVALPNTPTPVEEYDSGNLFVTKVAQEHYERFVRHEPATVTLQHCANYSRNGVCCFGQSCQFVHAVHYSEQMDAENVSDTASVVTTRSNNYSNRMNAAQGKTSTSFSDSSCISPQMSVTTCPQSVFASNTSPMASLTTPPNYMTPQGMPCRETLPDGKVVVVPINTVPQSQQKQEHRQQPSHFSPDPLNGYGSIDNRVMLLQETDGVYAMLLPHPSSHMASPFPGQPVYMLPY